MDIDEDDDFYAPEELGVPAAQAAPADAGLVPARQSKQQDEDLEEGEEEDEGGEMDEDDDSVSQRCLHFV